MRFVWLLLFALVLLAEAYALVHSATNDTLSYQVCRLRETWWARGALLGLYAWLGWHWFIESPRYRAYWHDDLIIVGLAVCFAALILRYAPHGH